MLQMTSILKLKVSFFKAELHKCVYAKRIKSWSILSKKPWVVSSLQKLSRLKPKSSILNLNFSYFNILFCLLCRT